MTIRKIFEETSPSLIEQMLIFFMATMKRYFKLNRSSNLSVYLKWNAVIIRKVSSAILNYAVRSRKAYSINH